MAMDTAMVQKRRSGSTCLAGIVFITNAFISHLSIAAEGFEITSSVEGEATYTDNVDLAASGEEDSEITIVTAGIAIESEGNDGSLSLEYEIKKTLYSYDSSQNELYNELSLDAEKGISQTNFDADVEVSIENISSAIDENASDDITTGDTIETRYAEIGVSYQSNPAGVMDLYARLNGSVTSNEDDVGDYSSYGLEINYDNGRAVKDYFWSLDYTYGTDIGQDDDYERTESHELTEELGFRPNGATSGFGPFARVYYEDYTGQDDDDSADSASGGPGLRYYWHDRSYIEVSYDFILNNDEDEEDYWRGALYVNPTSRTELSFDYQRRFYGDAYDFSLTHSNKRLTNTITYSEEVTSYDRSFYVDGDAIEALTIAKTLSWVSTLELSRTTVTVELSSENQEAVSDVSDNTDEQTYGSSIELSRDISPKTTVSTSFQFDYYKFEEDGEDDQKDYYRQLEIGVEHDPTEELSVELNIVHKNKSSSESDSGYKENSVNIVVRKEI